MKLAIISHTEHYLDQGQVFGFGPTVREINQLLEVFDEIWHIAVLHSGNPPSNALPYASDKVHFVPISPFGGPHWRDKLGALLQMPSVLKVVARTLQQVDCFQFRAPTGIGNYLIPWLTVFTNKPGWFKYAGNWVQKNAPPGYRWQRWWLSKGQNRPVTINGIWPDQAPHLWSFENPCMTEKEWETAQEQSQQKHFEGPLSLCFVGSLTQNKGIRQVLEALNQLENPVFDQIFIAGDGPLKEELTQMAKCLNIAVEMPGFQSRTQLNQIYAKAHFLILPSDNEGFPKVVAEAAAFGCIPITTAVSCIGQYVIPKENGFLLPDNSPESIWETFEQIGHSRAEFSSYSAQARILAKAFTYERYLQRIREVLKNIQPSASC